jgi:hypothetical protein
MKTGRRGFLAAGAAGALVSKAAAKEDPPGAPAGDRVYWASVATRLADPVLTNLARGTLKARMPVEEQAGANRGPVTHLEALGRLLAGLAPWLELPPDDTAEGRTRVRLLDLARRAVSAAVDPASPDFLNFTKDRQPLVDAAFLAEGLLRAPRALLGGLDATARGHLVRAFVSSRVTTPVFSNWLMFTASVEAGLAKLGADWDRTRVDYALRQHEQWYKGDGIYGDGPTFHWDYYNSLVIQPMLLDVLDACGDEMPAWTAMREPVRKRARRHAAVLERLIGPDGAFPPTGRSLAYRGGAFHLLAQVALRRDLPPEVTPAQVRGGLTAVLRRTMDAPGTFDAEGWLRIGFCGHQPGVGERYISTGSLYLCAVALLPLGLPADDPFWASPAVPWTSQLAWSGKPFPIDKALSE